MDPVRWSPTTDDDILQVVERYVRECFERKTPPRVSELSMLLRISRTRLTRTVQRHTGLSCLHYLHVQQVRKAMELIDAGASLTQVAYEAGFGTRRGLFRVFKQVTGITPASYRRTK